MDPVTFLVTLWLVLVTLWVLLMATLWLVRMLFEEAWAACRGQTSPRLVRRATREELAAKHGTPTVGQAIAARLVQRIENPPDRQWAAQLRAFLTELAADAVGEARVRHHVNQQARARRRARQAGWRVRTGGASARPTPPPPPPEDDTVMDTRPCRDCRTALVVPPDETCEACERATAPPPPDPDPDPDETPPELTENDTTPPDRKAPAMASATHDINGDVNNPITALEFSASCRGFNDGIVGELDILEGILTNKEVGEGPKTEVRLMIDAARTYSGSNERSEKEYAEHVVILDDIAADPELANTVRRTYLDGDGGDARTTARRAATAKLTIRASDCDAPADAARLMDLVAQAYDGLKLHVEQALDRHIQQRVSGKPLEFLRAQLEHATLIAGQAQRSAATFRRHIVRRDDTVGKNDAVRGTQQGKWLDTARA